MGDIALSRCRRIKCQVREFSDSSKNWLLSYVVSDRTVKAGRLVAPDNYTGEPLYGFAETLLWPAIVEEEQIWSISEDGYDLLIHRQGYPAAPKSVLDPSLPYMSPKIYMAKSEQGIWVFSAHGNVYFIKAFK